MTTESNGAKARKRPERSVIVLRVVTRNGAETTLYFTNDVNALQARVDLMARGCSVESSTAPVSTTAGDIGLDDSGE